MEGERRRKERAANLCPCVRACVIGIMLECALEAAENAGIPLEKLSGSKTGVFSAIERCEYADGTVSDFP